MNTCLAFTAICLASVSVLSGNSQTRPATSPWQLQDSATKAGLRGIHAVGGGVAWASGTNGTILRTEDGGETWQSCAMPPGAEKLDFRGIWAWDANTAVAMSSGPGDLSRLYKTTDGCSSWKLVASNPDKDGFWDAMVFQSGDFGQLGSDTAGVLIGDPVNGEFHVDLTMNAKGWLTEDHGCTANKGEAAFAASNSAIFVLGWRRYLLGTGGTSGARILASPLLVYRDATKPCRSSTVPLASGTDSSGVFSLAFRDQDVGIAVGGDYKKPNESNGTAAYTADGGKTWTAAAKPPHGYRSAVAWDAADKAHPGCWIAAGTNGSDVSFDDGKTWQYLDSGNWNALSLPWVVGPGGRIAKLVSLKAAAVSSPR